MAEKEIEFVWLICYVNSEHIDKVEKVLLTKKKYGRVKHYIPMVKILSKQFKGKDIYSYVPLLFNYGFFKVPLELAKNKEFVSGMKSDIKGIYGWVKNEDKKSWDSPYHGISIAIAKTDEIIQLLKSQANYSIYSASDLERVKEGDTINLKGYPFDNIDAEVQKIDFKKKEVKVKLCLEHGICKTVTVSFNNVFYSIYHGGYDIELFKEKSLDEIKERNNGTLDRIFAQFVTNPNL